MYDCCFFCMSSWTNLCPVPCVLSLAMEELGRAANCCVLWSSDGLSCSTAHFLFSICPHGLEAFFSLQLHEIIEIGWGRWGFLFIFCRENGFLQGPLLSFSGLEPDHWCGFHLSDVFWLICSNQSLFVSCQRVWLSVSFMCVMFNKCT